MAGDRRDREPSLQAWKVPLPLPGGMVSTGRTRTAIAAARGNPGLGAIAIAATGPEKSDLARKTEISFDPAGALELV
jgi:hypothetical protein